MNDPSLQSFCVFLVASAVICFGSEHPIRHHRVIQSKPNSATISVDGKSQPNSSGNDIRFHRTNDGFNLDSKLLTRYRRIEMKSVENLFRQTFMRDGNLNVSVKSYTKRESQKQDQIPPANTGVSIKFSGKGYKSSPNDFSRPQISQRGYIHSMQFPRPNKTSLWPMTYSPGTVEAALNNTSINITSESGNGIFLPCRVGHLGDTQISWIRRRDWHVITSGDNLYSNDRRFSVLHDKSSHDWTLHIKQVTDQDEGTYECQVSTDTGIISLFVNLSVVVPEAKILGKGQYHINKGSSIYITCVVYNNLHQPHHVLWYHNGVLLNFLRDRPDINISMDKSTVKHKIKNSLVPGTNFSHESNIIDVKSHLRIDSALELHSGNYSCSTPNSIPASLIVFITEGDKTAAVQIIDSGVAINEKHISNLFLFYLLYIGLTR